MGYIETANSVDVEYKICICAHGTVNSHRLDDYGQPKCDYCNGPCDVLEEKEKDDSSV